MKALVYYPCRVFAEETRIYRGVTRARVSADGYSITRGNITTSSSTSEEFEVVLLGDDEEDHGQ